MSLQISCIFLYSLKNKFFFLAQSPITKIKNAYNNKKMRCIKATSTESLSWFVAGPTRYDFPKTIVAALECSTSLLDYPLVVNVSLSKK